MHTIPTHSEHVECMFDLVRAARDQRTGGYDVTIDVQPQREAHRAGDGFWTVVTFESNDPDERLSGEYWFDDDGIVMQVL